MNKQERIKQLEWELAKLKAEPDWQNVLSDEDFKNATIFSVNVKNKTAYEAQIEYLNTKVFTRIQPLFEKIAELEKEDSEKQNIIRKLMSQLASANAQKDKSNGIRYV